MMVKPMKTLAWIASSNDGFLIKKKRHYFSLFPQRGVKSSRWKTRVLFSDCKSVTICVRAGSGSRHTRLHRHFNSRHQLTARFAVYNTSLIRSCGWITPLTNISFSCLTTYDFLRLCTTLFCSLTRNRRSLACCLQVYPYHCVVLQLFFSLILLRKVML